MAKKKNDDTPTEASLLNALRDYYGSKREEWMVLSRVRSSTGYVEVHRYADALAINLWQSSGCPLHGFEIKISRADLVKELTHPEKSSEIKQFCNHWWLIVPSEKLLREGELPDDWGLMTLRGSKLVIRKAAPPLSNEPIDPAFLASLLRTAYRQTPNQDEVKIAERRGVEKGKCATAEKITLKMGRDQVQRLSKLRDRLDTAIQEYHTFGLSTKDKEPST